MSASAAYRAGVAGRVALGAVPVLDGPGGCAVRAVDSALCADGAVRTFAGLSLAPERWRRHGWVYDAVNSGRIQMARLRWA
jgi:hypothetical protein